MASNTIITMDMVCSFVLHPHGNGKLDNYCSFVIDVDVQHSHCHIGAQKKNCFCKHARSYATL